MAQPQKVKMLPLKDMTKEAARPEKTMSGVKNESTKVLRTKQTYLMQQCNVEGVLPLNTKVPTETQDSIWQKFSFQ